MPRGHKEHCSTLVAPTSEVSGPPGQVEHDSALLLEKVPEAHFVQDADPLAENVPTRCYA